MTGDAIKGYINLLCHAWIEDDCGLPDDESALAAMAKLQEPNEWGVETETHRILTKWEMCKGQILVHFHEEDGRLYNTKLSGIFLEQKEKHLAQAKGGKSTQAKLRGKQTGKHSSKHVSKLELRASDSESCSSVVLEKKTADVFSVVPLDRGSDDWAESVYSRWLKRGDRILALQALSRLSTSREQFQKVYTRWCDYHAVKGWQFAPKLSVFLTDETYRYDPPPTKPKPEVEREDDVPCYLPDYEPPWEKKS